MEKYALEIIIAIVGFILTGLMSFLLLMFGILVWQMKELIEDVKKLNEKMASITSDTERNVNDIQLIFQYIKELQDIFMKSAKEK